MIFVCECGKRFKAPEGTPPAGNSCPGCGGSLRLQGMPAPAQDLHIINEQKKALRDELRIRDRQLRIAHNEILKLKAENEKLKEELTKARPDVPFVTIAEAPVVVDRSTSWMPMELPSERLDLSIVPALEEIPDLADAPHLPSDRIY